MGESNVETQPTVGPFWHRRQDDAEPHQHQRGDLLPPNCMDNCVAVAILKGRQEVQQQHLATQSMVANEVIEEMRALRQEIVAQGKEFNDKMAAVVREFSDKVAEATKAFNERFFWLLGLLMMSLLTALISIAVSFIRR